MEAIMDWILSTRLSAIITGYRWAWPIAETLHFTGLVVLFGTVAAFDLRMLGVARGVSPLALHKLLPWGIAGFVILALTGIAFISGAPDQYFYNDAFYVKVTALALMGVNVAVFYTTLFKRVVAMGPDSSAPAAVKAAAALSLLLLVVIMGAGRMLTFFRPIGYY